MIPLLIPFRIKELLIMGGSISISPIGSKGAFCSECKKEPIYKAGLCVVCYYSQEPKHKLNKEEKEKILNKIIRICSNINIFRERANSRRRKIRISNIVEVFTDKEWLEKLQATKGVCPDCNVWVGIAYLTIDHIYPISKASNDFLKTGVKRVYTIDDVRPLCLSCNCKKGVKLE